MEQEFWLPIKYGNGKKEISSFGNVRNAVTKKVLKLFLNGRGYLSISFWIDGKGKSFNVHRLVAEAFIPNPKNLHTVNHKDFIKTNNNVSNLEWCSLKENIAHYYREKFNHIITDEIVKFIRENIGVITPRNLAKQLNLSEGYVYGVANGIHCPDVYPELIREKRTSFPREVKKYDKSGNLLATYSSLSKAAKENNIRLSHLQRVLCGQRSSIHGLVYKCEGYQQLPDEHKLERLIKLKERAKANKLA